MKKSVKISIIAACGALVVLALFFCICALNHATKSEAEDAMLSKAYETGTYGTQYLVNGHQVNVYTAGSGSRTLVFLAGEGTCSPVLDFKSLYSLLTSNYKIAVVEHVGYGFSSETSSAARDLDSVLSETRTALSYAGQKGPYILVAHSLGSLEALYWVQKYPSEVRAVIGLDMVTPNAYDQFKFSAGSVKSAATAKNMGLARLGKITDGYAINNGTLTEYEQQLYKALYFKRNASRDMIREAEAFKANTRLLSEDVDKNLVMLMFVSDGSGTGFDTATWRNFTWQFADEKENHFVQNLDCGHHVHDYQYQKIAVEIIKFLG